MSKRFQLLAIYAVMVLGVLLLSGCATTAPQTTLIPTPVPCPAAEGLPDEPSRTLNLDATKPGEAVQAYAANRARWIGYAEALRQRLEACQ